MSVRRSMDAGGSPWAGLLVLVPIVNLVYMPVQCMFPTAHPEVDVPLDPNTMPLLPHEERIVGPPMIPERSEEGMSAALAIGISIFVGAFMLGISVYALSTYAASLFLGTPMVMGATASYFWNRTRPRGYGASISIGMGSVLFAMTALLLFAFEGIICLAMAAPLLLPIGAMGGLLGKMIADAARRPVELMAAVLILPCGLARSRSWHRSREYQVLSAVEIDAPPARVWANVVDFPELTEPPAWYFAWGIACPECATDRAAEAPGRFAIAISPRARSSSRSRFGTNRDGWRSTWPSSLSR